MGFKIPCDFFKIFISCHRGESVSYILEPSLKLRNFRIYEMPQAKGNYLLREKEGEDKWIGLWLP